MSGFTTEGGSPLTTEGGSPISGEGTGGNTTSLGTATTQQESPVAGGSPQATSSKLYLRKCSLIVADAAGEGLELSALHVRFQVKQYLIQTVNQLVVRVYNLSQQTAQKINKEFTQVVLQAGYEGQYGRIFSGQIIQLRRGRENATDTYLDIFAQDAEVAHNWGVINRSLAAGYTPEQVRKEALRAFGQSDQDVADGGVHGQLPSGAAPRGGVFFGMARDTMHDLASTHDFHWNLNNSQLTMVAQSAYLPNDAVVLTSLTGMLGIPEQTQDGIRVVSLLNPNIGAGQLIKIDNASIVQFLKPNVPIGNIPTATELPISLSDDGFYKVLRVDHVGDTRGNEWETDMFCTSVSGPVQARGEAALASPAAATTSAGPRF